MDCVQINFYNCRIAIIFAELPAILQNHIIKDCIIKQYALRRLSAHVRLGLMVQLLNIPITHHALRIRNLSLFVAG